MSRFMDTNLSNAARRNQRRASTTYQRARDLARVREALDAVSRTLRSESVLVVDGEEPVVLDFQAITLTKETK